MSLLPTQGRAARAYGDPAVPRPQLTVVPAPASRVRRVPFVALVVGVLAAGLVGLLVLNTSLQRGAYVVTDLRAEAGDLALRQQDLQVKVAALQAPQRVAEQALALGMVKGDSAAFLSLGTGKVVGVPKVGRPGNQLRVGGSASSREASRKATPLEAGTRNSSSTGIERVPSPAQGPGDERSRSDGRPSSETGESTDSAGSPAGRGNRPADTSAEPEPRRSG